MNVYINVCSSCHDLRRAELDADGESAFSGILPAVGDAATCTPHSYG